MWVDEQAKSPVSARGEAMKLVLADEKRRKATGWLMMKRWMLKQTVMKETKQTLKFQMMLWRATWAKSLEAGFPQIATNRNRHQCCQL
jgi:hypothetical protein